jgi:tetratricopeptide (TPR) repeat protein
MEAITRRVSLAYETLAASRTKRTATSSAAPAPKADPAREKALAALKQQIEARHAEARRLAAEAQKAAAHGDLASAADAYRRAVALAPKDGAIQAAYEQTRRAVETSASEGYARQAEFEERFEHWAEAATSWKRVLDARPDDARARDRLATALRRAGGGQSGAGS